MHLVQVIVDFGGVALHGVSVIVEEPIPLGAQNHVPFGLWYNRHNVVVSNDFARKYKVKLLIYELIEIAIYHLHEDAVVDVVEIEWEVSLVEILANRFPVINKP